MAAAFLGLRRGLVTGPQLRLDPFPSGFRASGVSCGIKKKKGVKDLALIKADAPCSAAGVFTTNKFRAAPVLACQATLKAHAGAVQGVVINAGVANACTGDKGLEDAMHMCRHAASTGMQNPLVMSTGVIGPFLPMEKVERGITEADQALTAELSGWSAASEAIMTTDTIPKLTSQRFGDLGYTIAGMCKGSGMIHPNMATMLAVLVTDANVSAACLDNALRHAADRSFNCVSVDGDTSTNDSLCALANGASQSPAIVDTNSREFHAFQNALTETCHSLSQMLVRDGEGATKFVSITVKGGRTYLEAKRVAESIATSSLVKTALYGQDANWGRILCAAGYSGVEFDPSAVDLWFRSSAEQTSASDLQLVRAGQPFDVDEARASALLKLPNVNIEVGLSSGSAEATVWTCDFSLEYVTINGDYRS